MFGLRNLIGWALPEKRKTAFREMEERFVARTPRWRAVPRGAVSGRVSVIVTPWMQTAVPFFSLEMALMLYHAGHAVRVLWDSANVLGNAAKERELTAISEALAALPREIEVIDLAHLPAASAARETDAALSARILFDNAVMRRRGETTVEEFYRLHPDARARIEAHLRKVRALLTAADPGWLLLPGGIYGVSPIYVALAQELGLAITTYDCGYGMLVIAHGGVAGHQHDIADSYRHFAEHAAAEPVSRAVAETSAQHELQQRMIGKGNYFDFQMAAAEGREQRRFDLLVPLNLRWDAAALGRQHVFPSVADWLSRLIEWVGSRPGVRLCIRQHPVERFEPWRSSDDVRGMVERLNPDPERIVFVAADDPVNTYELLVNTRVVLPFTSSVGVEAAMLGKAVVLATHSYYQGFAFAHKAGSVEEYFALIERALRGEFGGTEATRATAAQVYHLTQRCNLMRTKFTAEPRDYPEWVDLPPTELWAQPETLDLREALLTRTPLSFLRHRRFAAEPPATAA